MIFEIREEGITKEDLPLGCLVLAPPIKFRLATMTLNILGIPIDVLQFGVS